MSRPSAETRSSAPPKKLGWLLTNPIVWIGFLGSIYALAMWNATRFELPPEMPVLGSIDDFELRDQYGEPYGTKELEGKAWVANFIFTRCPTVCPAFSQKMRQIQHRTRGLSTHFRLISFSVDPEYDTPERLMAYATTHGASKTLWRFLTGPIDTVKHVVEKGLKMAMGNDSPEGNFEGIFHGSHFVLVDANRQIRGFFDANEADAVDQVVRAAGLLLNRGD